MKRLTILDCGTLLFQAGVTPRDVLEVTGPWGTVQLYMTITRQDGSQEHVLLKPGWSVRVEEASK